MLKNYFTIAWRSLWKNKIFSLINIFGLAVGITFTMLTGAFVWGELQVNHNLKDLDNQYILQSKWKDPNFSCDLCTIAQLPKTLHDLYPNLVSNYYHWDGVTSNVSKGDKHFRESMQVGDSTLFSMYGFDLLHGNSQTALKDPFSAIVTERLAEKFFGRTDVIGETINIESFTGSRHNFTISGVLKKIAQNSVTSVNDDNRNDIFLPAKAAVFLGRSLDGWNNTNLIGYLELKNGVTPKDLEEPMRHLIKENAPEQLSKIITPYLLPLKTYYQNANNGAIKQMLYTLSYIALFILLMAIINFVNICIGRSSARMKEMGIRKVLGGLRKQLIWQFLTESVIVVMIATIIALILYALTRQYFGDILNREITGIFAFPVYFYLLPFVFALFVGLLAGVYPALVLSALKSVDSLKGKLSAAKESILFRKVLIGFQFGTAALIFIITIIISQQVALFFNGDMGFKKDYIVYAQLPRDWSEKGVKKMEAIRYQMAQMPQVSSVTLSWQIPDGAADAATLYRNGTDPKKAVPFNTFATDNQYAATYQIPIKAGSFFLPQYAPGDSAKIVINETASKRLGFNTPQEAVGQLVSTPGMPGSMTIVGVTGDFHFGSIEWKIEPVNFVNVNFTHLYRFFSFKLKPGNMQQNIEALQTQWNKLLPDAPFEYHFMDEALSKLYSNEIQLKKAASLATALAVIIVLLGVLGLISLSVQKRTREIGIRKVLGSSTPQIIFLFLKDFLSVLIVACLVACPMAYLIMHSWLTGYTYRVNITPLPFIGSVGVLAVLTIILIILQTIKAALSNPVKSLRTE